MIIAGLIFAGLAAALHVYIFVLESIIWTSPRARATFGTTEAEAEATKELASNQGFYNLMLAIVTAVGIVFVATNTCESSCYSAGLALIFAGAGSMVAAGVYLLCTSPSKVRAAVTQLALPLIAITALAIASLN